MSDFERLKYERQLVEKERQIKDLRLRLDGLRDSLRHHLDPIDPPEALKGDKIAGQAMEFAALQTDLLRLLAETELICRILGR